MKSLFFKARTLLVVITMVFSLAIEFEITCTKADAIQNTVNAKEMGTIFHAWSWRFEEITAHLSEIKEAGFTSIQVSPVQGHKKTSGMDRKSLYDFWAFYQPTNFEIGNELGNEDQFKSLCEKARKAGLKIIVDVVANHMADGKESHDSADASEPAIDKAFCHGKKLDVYLSELGLSRDIDPTLLKAEYWYPRCNEDAGMARNRYTRTRGRLSNQPSLNTSNHELQEIIIKFLEKLIEAGADGIRFDAARHIELPDEKGDDEYQFGSNFWPRVTAAIKEIGEKQNPSREIFVYGEILGNLEDKAERNYLNYMNVVADRYSANVINAIRSKNAANVQDYGVYGLENSPAKPSQLVTWLESHDKFAHPRESTTSNDLKPNQVRLGWGITGGREGPAPLFLARPACGLSGTFNKMMLEGETPVWKSREITQTNKFHNMMKNESEYVRRYGDVNAPPVFVVERGETISEVHEGQTLHKMHAKGVIMTNLSDYECSLEGECTGLTNGEYKDQMSDRRYKVKDGKFEEGTLNGNSICILLVPECQKDVAPWIDCDRREAETGICTFYGQLSINLKANANLDDKAQYTVEKTDSTGSKKSKTTDGDIINSTRVNLGDDDDPFYYGKFKVTVRYKGLTKTYTFQRVPKCTRRVIFIEQFDWFGAMGKADWLPKLYIYDDCGPGCRELTSWSNLPCMEKTKINNKEIYQFEVPETLENDCAAFNSSVKVIFVNDFYLSRYQLPCPGDQGFILPYGTCGIFEDGNWKVIDLSEAAIKAARDAAIKAANDAAINAARDAARDAAIKAASDAASKKASEEACEKGIRNYFQAKQSSN